MSTRHVLAAMLVLAATSAPAAAQQSAGRWSAWIGCWEPRGETAQVGATSVCIAPGTATDEAVLITIVDAKVVSRQTVLANGERRAVSTGGCTGWESARWSDDDHRVFLRSELDCAGTPRVSSGILAILPDGGWLDVRTLGLGDEAVTTATRFVAATVPELELAGIASYVSANRLAIETARAVAGARLSVNDVVEAGRTVHPEAIQALLIQRDAGFDLDAQALRDLEEAGLAGATTDLMIALSFPDRFQLNAFGRPAPRATESEPAVMDPWVSGRDGWRDPWRSPWGYGGWGAYGYCGYNGYNAYGLNRFRNDCLGTSPIYYDTRSPTIVVEPRLRNHGGKVISGKGYTRGGAESQGGTAEARSRVERSGSDPAPSQPDRASSQPERSRDPGGRVEKSGTSGSGDTGRHAKPRGNH